MDGARRGLIALSAGPREEAPSGNTCDPGASLHDRAGNGPGAKFPREDDDAGAVTEWALYNRTVAFDVGRLAPGAGEAAPCAPKDER
jgi:hypothetical protein